MKWFLQWLHREMFRRLHRINNIDRHSKYVHKLPWSQCISNPMDKRLQILSSRLPKYPNQLLSKKQLLSYTMFKNRSKSRIQLCEGSELRLLFESTCVQQKCQKWSILVKQCYQTGHHQYYKNWWKMTRLEGQMRHFQYFSNIVSISSFYGCASISEFQRSP